MSGGARDLCVLNEINWICAPGVLSDACVGVIDVMILMEDDVLQDSAETQCLKNVRLAFRCKIDRLSVTASFDVENPVVAPDMLVVTDEVTFRIGRERCFACAAKTEKQRGGAGLFVSRSRAMHREQSALRREIIDHCKNTFLHLTCVFGAKNDQFLVFEA